MNKDLVYWIWASLCFPPGSPRLQHILEEMTPAELYAKRMEEPVSELPSSSLTALRSVSLEQAEKIMEDCRKQNVGIAAACDPEYPQRLLQIETPPPVIYWKGNIDVLRDTLTIGIVGTRHARPYYLRCTGNISYQLARAGAVIISGCAVGCDQYAHLGAVKAGGATVGVLACGFGVNYPAATEELRTAMLKKGALITELPPGTHNESRYFRIRNRLISGLSEGVLVTQVPLRSGSLLTASHAVDQGKDLFCIPPDNIYESDCMGAAVLLRDCGRVVFSARDILDEYAERFSDSLCTDLFPPADMMPAASEKAEHPNREKHSSEKMSEKPRTEKKAPEKEEPAPEPPAPDSQLSPEQEQIWKLLADGPQHVEVLCSETGMASYELLAVLTELELTGIVRALSGRRYERAV